MHHGVVPDEFKLATVAPIFKNGSKTDASNYRPMAIVTALSKVLEAVVVARMGPHLELVLPDEQHGFRPKRSVVTAMSSLLHECNASKSRGESIALVAFDFSSAFDCTAVEPLVAEAVAVGFAPDAIKWIKSWLTGRRQRTSWNGSLSPYMVVKYGVPQGTLSGPMYFSLVTRSLPSLFRREDAVDAALRPVKYEEVSPDSARSRLLQLKWDGMEEFSAKRVKTSTVIYADDATGCIAHKTPSVVICVAERLAAAFAAASRSLGLSISVAKTQLLMIGGGKKEKESPSSITVGDNVVHASDSINVLGVHVDRELSTAPHLRYLLSAMKSRAGIIKRLSYCLPRRQLTETAKGVVFSKLRSSISLVAEARMTDADGPASVAEGKIQREINALARVLTRARRTDHIRIPDLLHRAKLPSLNSVVAKAAAGLAWTSSHEGHPLHRAVHALNQPFGGRGKEEGILRLPRRSNPAIYSAVRAWNSSAALRKADTEAASKRMAKEIGSKVPL